MGLSQAKFAEVAGVSQVTIHQLERGLTAGSVPSIKRMAKKIGCTPNDLLFLPTSARLAEIRASRLEREAAQARAEADRQQGVA